ncbi:MAG: molybdenum cofactor guanylyltransferase [Nitrospirae bacterium]|nr:molybdenum cofactor guanylyltransferase [Nitrospirota bacterium]MBI5695781.1 molybdenum cofactor guanylyltransferase [Nitrospirota bacterium]
MKPEKLAFPATAVILAGGENSRMGTPKSFVRVGGVTIIERELRALSPLFDEVVVVTRDPALYAGLGCRVAGDVTGYLDVRGPLIGVYSGIQAARNEYIFVAGCDMPFMEPGLVRYMAALAPGRDAVVPRVGPYLEPLFAFYRSTAGQALEDALRQGGKRLQDVYKSLDVMYVAEDEARGLDPELQSFFNVNTPADLAVAESSVKVCG